MKRWINMARRPYLYGLLTVLLLVASLSFISRPLFTPKENAAKVSSSNEVGLSAQLDDMVNVQTIRDLASADGTGEPVERIKLEQENDRLQYVVALRDGTILAYDAKTGETVSPEGKSVEDDGTQPLPANFRSVINFSRARALGLEKIPNGIVKKISYAVEDGVVVYSVRFKDGQRVDIDAATGKVVRVDNKKQDDKSQESNRDRKEHNDKQRDDSSSSHRDRSDRTPYHSDRRSDDSRNRDGRSDDSRRSSSSDDQPLSSLGIRLDTLWR